MGIIIGLMMILRVIIFNRSTAHLICLAIKVQLLTQSLLPGIWEHQRLNRSSVSLPWLSSATNQHLAHAHSSVF